MGNGCVSGVSGSCLECFYSNGVFCLELEVFYGVAGCVFVWYGC